MQSLATKAAHHLQHGGRRVPRHDATGAVAPVACQRMPCRGQVDAHLMGAAGFELRFDQRVGAEPLAYRHVGHGPPPVFAHRLPQAVARIAANRLVDALVGDHAPFDHGEIAALHAMRAHVLRQAQLTCSIASDDEQAAGVLVQTMHQASPRQFGQFRAAVQQAVDQRAPGLASSRMHGQPGRLVHDDHRLVLVDDAEVQPLGGLPVEPRRPAGGDDEVLAADEGRARLRLGAIDQNAPSAYPARRLRARRGDVAAAEQRRQAGVQSLTAELRRHDDVQPQDRLGVVDWALVCASRRHFA